MLEDLLDQEIGLHTVDGVSGSATLTNVVYDRHGVPSYIVIENHVEHGTIVPWSAIVKIRTG